MRTIAAAVVAAALLGHSGPAEAADPAAATVMIRVVGEITAALGPDARAWRPTTEVRDVQFATGSGFLISRDGYVVTNSHVIRGGHHEVRVDGQVVEITLAVRAIYVVVPGGGDDVSEQVLEASIVANDPAVDLALLHVAAVDLPVAPLGDAMALSRGDAVSAYGYPLGDRLAAGGPGNRAPPVSASTGTVAALREGGTSNLPATVPYVQFTAPVNPGNSGGPLVDRDGYVVGVVQAKVRQAEGVGLAISVAEVKRFLERNGADAALAVKRLSPGPLVEVPGKGVRAAFPAGFSDASPARARIDSGDSLAPLRLQVDRVVSAWDLDQLERELLRGAAFGAPEFRYLSDRLRDYQPTGRARLGLAVHRGDDGETRMLHAVLGVAEDVLVARYTGPADDIAYNLSVLRESLVSIQAASLVSRPVSAPLRTDVRRLGPGASAAVTADPWGTFVDGAVLPGCEGLPSPEGSVVLTPDGDFTVRFGAARWSATAGFDEVRRACVGSAVAGTPMRSTVLGLAWTGERNVVRTPGGDTLLLELWAPATKFPFARDAFRAWSQALTSPAQ